jgi:putative MATE family efflux protein
MTKKSINLLSGPVDSSLRHFVFPLAFSFLIHIVYSWVDMYYVSLLGESQMAAMGVSERIWFFTFAIGSGFAIGSSVIISRRIGERNQDEADKTATQSLVFMFLFAVVIALVFWFSLPFILNIMGISNNLTDYAVLYFTGLIFGIPFNFLIFQINAIIRSTGDSFFPMVILISSNIVNAILTPLMMFGIGPFPELGIFGAGLATAHAQLFGAAFGILLLLKGKAPVSIIFKDFRLDFGTAGKIFKIGVPASLQLIVVSLNSIGIAAIANKFGTEVLATFIIGLRVDLLVSMPIFAVGAAIEIISGQNLGALQLRRIFEYHRSALKKLSIVIIIASALVFIFGGNFAKIFTEDPKIINEVENYLRIVAFNYMPFSVGIITLRVISGAGAYFRSLAIVSIVMLAVQLPLAFGLSSLFNSQNGIWFGMLISSIIFAVISLFELNRKKWIRAKV